MNKISVFLYFIIFMPTLLNATTLQFSGNLIIPPCTINKNATINHSFGDIQIQTLQSVNTPYHGSNIAIPIECPYKTNSAKLSVTGNSDNPTAGILKTSKYSEGLVIYLKQRNASSPIQLNNQNDIISSIDGNVLYLWSGVGRTGDIGNLTAGGFNASVELTLQYY